MKGSARPLSIVQIVDDLNAGGLERFAIDLAIAHKGAGHRSAIFCLGGPGELAGEAEAAGVAVTAFHKARGVNPGVVWRLRGALQQARADVVHAHNPGVHHYAVVAARLAGVPVVVNTRHGVSSSSGRPYDEKYFKAALRWTGKVVYVSRDSERYYSGRIVPAAQGMTIWNGIPLEPFLAAPVPPNAGATTTPRLRLVTLGRLVPVKAHDTLLDAFAIVAAAEPGAELRIYGQGDLRGALEERIARLGLAGRAMLGGQTRDVPGVLAAADLFVLSSTSEGLPMVILQAMGAGLPIVSTRVGGVPEVAPEGEAAWYCPAGDAAALARTILEAARSGKLGERGRRARQLAVENLSIDAAQQRYLALFRQLLDGKGARR